MDFLPAPERARRRAWLQFTNLGVAHDEQVLAARRGFLTRRVAVIPHARTQSVRLTQGPWQRRLGLAGAGGLDAWPGLDRRPAPVAGEAREIAEAQLVRAAAGRRPAPGSVDDRNARARHRRSRLGCTARGPILPRSLPEQAAPSPTACRADQDGPIPEFGQGSP